MKRLPYCVVTAPVGRDGRIIASEDPGHAYIGGQHARVYVWRRSKTGYHYVLARSPSRSARRKNDEVRGA